MNDVYETGRLLTKIGCVLTADMTIEAIYAKLMYLMGKVRQQTEKSYLNLIRDTLAIA